MKSAMTRLILIVAAAALALAARELVFYFGEYAKLDAWAHTRLEGGAVAKEGRDAWVVSLGSHFHMVNSGWVYHLAPDSLRAGILSPGFHLPLTIPASRDLAFLFYPGQEEYRHLVEAIYPGGSFRRVPDPPDQWIFDGPRGRPRRARSRTSRTGRRSASLVLEIPPPGRARARRSGGRRRCACRASGTMRSASALGQPGSPSMGARSCGSPRATPRP